MPYYEYCTVADLRAEGITPEEATDDLLLMRIKIVSAKINAFTSQFFAPTTDDQYVDGQNSRMVWLPNFVPIQKLSNISILSTKTARGTAPIVLPDRRYWTISIGDVELSRNNRIVEWVFDISHSFVTPNWIDQMEAEEVWFPEGRKNVKLEGVFGWLEDSKDVTSTVVGNFAIGVGKITVNDASEWTVGDYIIFPDGSMQIVTGVAKATNELLLQGDPYKLRVALSNGDTVVTYGRAPLLVRWCAIKLANNASPKLNDSESEGWDDVVARAIVSEKTDNYSYRLDPSLLRESIEAGSGSTGDSEVDSILQQMIDDVPTYIGFV